MTSQIIQNPIICVAVHAPKASIAQIGQTGAKLIAEQPKEAEHDVTVTTGVGNQFFGTMMRFLFQQPVQQVRGVPQTAGDDDARISIYWSTIQ